MDQIIKDFQQNKYAVVKPILEPSVVKLAYNYFILKSCTNRDFQEDSEDALYSGPYIKGAYADLVSEVFLSELEPTMKHITQKNLAPSYTYSRVYVRGEELKPHSDRPSCQYSVTVNIGGAPWPIYFGVWDDNADERIWDGGRRVRKIAGYTLQPGEGIVYMGEDLVHWRDPLEDDHCVQVFLHYVDQDDEKYKPHIYDGRKNIGYLKPKK